MYCIDPYAEVPVFLIDKQIGKDDENPDEGYIDGMEFARELLSIDSAMKPKKMLIKINSPGGSVMQGMSIYDAILNSNASVDTYCTGMACSIAGVIFQAGKKRIMADYAKLMYHPVSGDDKGALEACTSAVAMMIAKGDKSKLDSILAIMKKTTWIEAEEAKDAGLCDQVADSGQLNKPRMTSDPKAFWKVANQLQNKLPYENSLKTENKMSDFLKITNKLRLTSAANEDQIIEAIEMLSNKAKTSQEAMQKAIDEVADLKAKLTAKETELANMKTELDSEKAAKNLAALAEKKAQATNKIKEIGKGRIDITKAEVVNKWVEKFVADEEGTTEMINSIPLNAAAASVDNGGGEKVVTPGGKTVIGNMMAEIREKNKLS